MSTVNRPKTRAGAEFFQQPTTAAHRQYEALRAYFVEGLAAAAVAEQFGYTTAAFYALCRDFRAQRLEFFRAPSKPGPKPVHYTHVALQQNNSLILLDFIPGASNFCFF